MTFAKEYTVSVSNKLSLHCRQITISEALMNFVSINQIQIMNQRIAIY